MRASTLFALTAAVLIFLGVAVVAKMAGWFNPREAPIAKRTDIPVLVAAKNIFANDMIQASGVRVRNLKADEVANYKANPGNYLPAMAAAGALRIAKVNIEADTPITKDLLKELSKPTPLNERLTPDMRAINLTISKERSAGGLVQVGEWVEVYLTSVIDGVGGTQGARTATIVPKARVIAKRDSLWPVFAPLPKDKPIEYTLEVNSYRAALIEFCRNKGQLSLSPLPAVEQKKLEAARQEKLSASKKKNNEEAQPPVAAIEAAPVDGDDKEMELAESVDKGELVVTDADLVLLFGIKRPQSPPPPALVNIERISGIRRVDNATFTLDGQRYVPGADGTLNNNTGYGNTRFQVLPNGSGRKAGDLHSYYNGLRGVGPTGTGPLYGGYGTGYGPGAGDAANFKFTTPDCPSCKKNKY